LRLFPATKDVIQNEDRENGIISGKGYFSFTNIVSTFMLGSSALVNTTINIIIKDNKYKVEIFDFYKVAASAYEAEGPIENYYTPNKKNQKYWHGYFVNFNNKVILLLAQINDEMSKKLSTDF
jgi:hypothetical protein